MPGRIKVRSLPELLTGGNIVYMIVKTVRYGKS
jgi:hypothetical protein